MGHPRRAAATSRGSLEAPELIAQRRRELELLAPNCIGEPSAQLGQGRVALQCGFIGRGVPPPDVRRAAMDPAQEVAQALLECAVASRTAETPTRAEVPE